MGDSFTFSGTQEEKKNTTLISFWLGGRVAHVPQNLVEEFPNLTWLVIWVSEIPIVRNDLLGPQFTWIEKLELENNQIKIIEEQAFQHLQNLVEIYLSNNEIQTLSGNLFEKNRKLGKIVLQSNKIKMLDPKTFHDLNQLQFVVLDYNECYKWRVGCWGCDTKINRAELNHELQNCYKNYKKSLDLRNKGEKFF